jgi:hypothetical protein
MRYMETDPKFIKIWRRVLYNSDDLLQWIQKNAIQRTDDSRGLAQWVARTGSVRQH